MVGRDGIGQWNNEAFHDAWKHLNTAATATDDAERKAEERAATRDFWRACGMDYLAAGTSGGSADLGG